MGVGVENPSLPSGVASAGKKSGSFSDDDGFDLVETTLSTSSAVEKRFAYFGPFRVNRDEGVNAATLGAVLVEATNSSDTIQHDLIIQFG